MKFRILIFCLCFYLFFSKTSYAQKTKEKETRKGMHQITLVIGHSHITDGATENGDRKWIVVPSWGFDYNYWIAEHWAIGLHTDIMIESFFVKEQGDENKTIERTRPFAAVPVVVFKPKEHSAFIAGIGAEFAKEGNFALARLGYEYGWELPNNWELAPSLTYDIKLNAYDTWTLGLGVSKFFGRK